MARYAETLKNRVVAKLLPPESASVSAIAKEVGVPPRVRLVVALL
jgi:transposase-like protein